MKPLLACLVLVILFGCSNNPKSEQVKSDHSELNWIPFNHQAFDRAKKENKLLLLEIGANWCHWCHVMDEKTYSDHEVISYLNQHFITAREDQDSRPDLYAAYRNWGWPAIIVFDPDKNEVLKLKGYQEKTKFLDLLKKTVKNPQPIPEESFNPTVLNASDRELFNRFLTRIDHEKGMFIQNHKYLQLPGIEHGLKYFRSNDSLKNWIDLSVKNSYNLIDPVWGGAYQYSTKKSWDNQHYEKLLRVQANYIEGYSRYGMISGDQKSIQMAELIYDYCERFLGNETPLFYNSQNADVIVGKESDDYYQKSEEERLKIGTPSIDQNTYLKENAMIGRSLVYLWAATNNENYLNRAIQMVDYITSGHFESHSGVYNRNAENGADMFSFEDNRELLELFMILYQATGNNKYLECAENSGIGMELEFMTDNGMVSSAQTEVGQTVDQINNLDAALNYNYLSHLTKNEKLKTDFTSLSRKIFSKLDQESMANIMAYLPVIIRAKQELSSEPYHAVLITNGKTQEEEKAYYKVILAHTDQYIVFERAIIGKFTEEQKLLYDGMPSGTLFMCTSSYCSAPIKSTLGLQEFLKSN